MVQELHGVFVASVLKPVTCIYPTVEIGTTTNSYYIVGGRCWLKDETPVKWLNGFHVIQNSLTPVKMAECVPCNPI